jgi:U3 small nucleolar RNA-associated protein 25
MSTAVQLKLLTLLNVSAIKRPRDADQPGAQRRSISVSPSVQIQPQSSNEGESSNAAGEASEEPPTKKKKRGVSFGGEVGPSGSGGKKEKTSKRKEDVAAGKEQVNGASKSIPVIEEEASETDVTESQLVAEEDSDDEAPATGTSSSVTGQCTTTT